MAEPAATLWEYILQTVPGARLDSEGARDWRTSCCKGEYEEESGFFFDQPQSLDEVIQEFFKARGWAVSKVSSSGFYIQTGERDDLLVVIISSEHHVLVSVEPILPGALIRPVRKA